MQIFIIKYEIYSQNFYNHQVILLNKLTICYMQTARQCRRLIHELKFNHSVYFLKGNDSRLLSLEQQQQISSFVSSQSLKTSCLVYNPMESLRKLRLWNESLPWIKPHYAVKSNPYNKLLTDFVNNGAGLDCASKAQIIDALNTGLSPQSIVYSNPIKDETDLQWAAQNGIELTTADSIDELHKIKQFAPNMRVLWRIAIKEQASDKLSTPFSGKFGDDLQSIEKIHQRMSQIQDIGINLKGIHFHCGSGHHGSSAFGKAILFAKSCMKIGRNYGHQMSLLDIGGGFPSGDLSQMTIETLKATKDDPLNYKVIAQPGRHFSANSCYLLTRVLGKRLKNGKPCYHLNQSLYHSFSCNLMDGVSFENSNDQFYSRIDSRNSQPSDIFETETSTLFGMTCDGMDVITKNIAIPRELKVGDWLCISGMGAYTYGCRSKFNGMESTEKVITWPTIIDEVEKKKATESEIQQKILVL